MILVFGTICLDRVRRIERLPGPGGYAEVLDEFEMLGGEAANTARALHAWGADVVLAGNPLGSGASAEKLRELVLEKGLSAKHLELGVGRTPVCDVYVTPDGERTMFGLGFKDIGLRVRLESLPLSRGDWFTLDPNLGEAARQAVRLAREAGMRLYLMDFVGEGDLIPEGAYWQSSTDWCGVRGNVAENLAWTRRWIAKHGAHCVLTDGALGFAYGAPHGAPRWFPSFPAPKVRDATGAGDMFRAGMLFGLEKGWPVSDCLRFASAAAALKCQGLGATGYVPTADEVRDYVRSFPEIAAQYD